MQSAKKGSPQGGEASIKRCMTALNKSPTSKDPLFGRTKRRAKKGGKNSEKIKGKKTSKGEPKDLRGELNEEKKLTRT